MFKITQRYQLEPEIERGDFNNLKLRREPQNS